MKVIARGLVLLAVVGHVGLGMVDAAAQTSPGGPGTATGPGTGPGPGTGHGPAPGQGHGGGGNPAAVFAPGVTTPSVAGACGAAPQLPDPNAYANAVDGLAAISQETERYIERCGCATQACVADALDAYAAALQKVAPRLPRALRSLPHVVAAAAHQARVAPTLRAAVHVVKAAAAFVHKAIALMRAADPDAVAAATRGGELVAHTLGVAATALERAETL